MCIFCGEDVCAGMAVLYALLWMIEFATAMYYAMDLDDNPFGVWHNIRLILSCISIVVLSVLFVEMCA